MDMPAFERLRSRMRFIAVRLKNSRSLYQCTALRMQDAPVNSSGPASVASADKILRSVISLSGGDILSRLIAFSGVAYLRRKIGTAGFGIVVFVLVILSYFVLVTTFGVVAVVYLVDSIV